MTYAAIHARRISRVECNIRRKEDKRVACQARGGEMKTVVYAESIGQSSIVRFVLAVVGIVLILLK